MSTFIEYFQYPFFVRAVVAGSVMGLLLSWTSSYVVLRREVLFTHALSNIGFLGIALAVLFGWPITMTLLVACFVAALLIRFLQAKRLFANDSLLGIFSQIGLALGVIVIGLFPGYRVNIEQFLFGDILGISSSDVILSLVLLGICGGLMICFHKNFLRISLSDTLSHLVLKRKRLYHTIFTVMLAAMIALAMKIIGVLLVAAFTTIPSNCAKLVAKNMRQNFIISTVVGILSTLIGIHASVIFNLPSGPMIVCSLGAFWVVSMLYNKYLS